MKDQDKPVIKAFEEYKTGVSKWPDDVDFDDEMMQVDDMVEMSGPGTFVSEYLTETADVDDEAEDSVEASSFIDPAPEPSAVEPPPPPPKRGFMGAMIFPGVALILLIIAAILHYLNVSQQSQSASLIKGLVALQQLHTGTGDVVNGFFSGRDIQGESLRRHLQVMDTRVGDLQANHRSTGIGTFVLLGEDVQASWQSVSSPLVASQSQSNAIQQQSQVRLRLLRAVNSIASAIDELSIAIQRESRLQNRLNKALDYVVLMDTLSAARVSQKSLLRGAENAMSLELDPAITLQAFTGDFQTLQQALQSIATAGDTLVNTKLVDLFDSLELISDDMSIWQDNMAPLKQLYDLRQQFLGATQDFNQQLSSLERELRLPSGDRIYTAAVYGLPLLAAILLLLWGLAYRKHAGRLGEELSLHVQRQFDEEAKTEIADLREANYRISTDLAEMNKEFSESRSELDERDELIVDLQQKAELQQKSILQLLNEMSALAEGDLTIKATVTDQITGAIADSINYAVLEMRGLVSSIHSASEQVHGLSTAASESAREVSQSNLQHAEGVSSAANKMEEMAESMRKMFYGAKKSADMAEHSAKMAYTGTSAVRKTIRGMDGMRRQIQETSKRIKRLGESSQRIGDIVTLIDDIADQTKILSVNASIKASSMAGDSSKAFATITEEVQLLVERSTTATQKIANLIETIQQDTKEAIASMEHATQEVVAGTKLADTAGKTLTQIELSSSQLSRLIIALSKQAYNQASIATHVSQNIAEIRQHSKETADQSSESADSIEQLTDLATDLKSSIARFKLPDESLKGGDDE